MTEPTTELVTEPTTELVAKLPQELADRMAAAEAARVAAAKAEAEAVFKAAREAAAAPEREKVLAFAAMLRGMRDHVPDLTTDAGAILADRITDGIGRMADWCAAEAAKL